MRVSAPEPRPDTEPTGPPDFEQFGGTLYGLTPHLVVTPALIVANVIVCGLMLRDGVNWLMPAADALRPWGANFRPDVVVDGEWWRLASSLFVHAGVIHLAANMWGLYALGSVVERFVGNVGMALVYLVAGLAGSLTTLYRNEDAVSVGASGAIFGLMGALLGFVVLRRDTIPWPLLRNIVLSCLFFLALNIAIGLSLPIVDNAAHFGGLAAGAACGAGLSQPLTPAARRGRLRRNLLVAFVAGSALVVAAGMMPTAKERFRAARARFNEAEDLVTAVYEEDGRRYDAGEIDAAAFADAIERDVLPPWRESHARIERVPKLPPDWEEARQMLQRSLALRAEAWELEADSLRGGDADALRRAEVRHREANVMLRRYRVLERRLR